ncbi:MAG: type II toxin-antitoxin system VapC family toxin [Akkermansiaceae bacterium]|nr:type II toxin-antitoxin system VapC family toxin [Akkermansiaceae bacterium]
MRTAVDSSVLLCILRRQAGWERWRDGLNRAAGEGFLVLCPVVFAECSMGFANVDEARKQLDSLCIVYDAFTTESAYLAGQMFLRYRREGGPRQHLIPDFLIAAHASVQADRFAAIDRGYLRAYFPTLALLNPST